MTAESRACPRVDLEWGAEPAPDVVEVAVRRPGARPATAERAHPSPVLLGVVFGSSALAIVVLLGVMLWTGGGRGAGPRAGERLPLSVDTAAPENQSLARATASQALSTTPRPTAAAATATATVTVTAAASAPPLRGESRKPAPTPTPAPSKAVSGSGSGQAGTLRAGDQGPEVAELQRLLFKQGFTYVGTTGTFDDATTRGVAQLQHDRSLSCDPPGVYGPCTRAALTG